MGTIIVGLDGSPAAAGALAWAAQEADRRRWALVAVLAWIGFDPHTVPVLHDGPTVTNPELARQTLDRFVLDAVGPVTAAGIDRRPVWGTSAPVLLEAAREADLLVMGARGVGGFRELLLGSVSQECLEHAPCPVAIVREEQWPPAAHSGPPRVVVGYDGSDPARPALLWAVEEARLRAADLDVVHAWQRPYAGGFPYTALHFDPSPVEDAAARFLHGALESLDTTGVSGRVEPIVVESEPASALIETAKGADLLVVGSRGRGGFTSLLLGSVSHKLARHAPCPIVVTAAEA